MDARLNSSSGLTAPAAGSGMLRRRLFLGVAALVIGLVPAAFSAPAALAAAGDITTIAGNGFNGYSGDGGPATSAAMMAPAGVAFSGSDLLIADFYSHTVRRVTPGGTITTLAGTGTAGYSGDGGAAGSARLNQPADVVTDAAGNVYIADFGNARIRRVTPGGTISTFAGTGTPGYSGDGGPATSARLDGPAGLEVDAAGNVYVTDFLSHTVRRINTAGIITTVAGTGTGGFSGDGGPATSARLDAPGDVAADGAGNLFVGEFSGHRVRKVSAGGTITTVGGTGSSGYSGNGGPATSAQMSSPVGVDVDSVGNIFVAEYGNHVIRRIAPSGIITRVAGTSFGGFAGDGGPALSAQIQSPSRVTLSPAGDFYISDWGNHRVRHVEALGSPNAPVLSSTSPASPSPSNTPRVIGSAPSGSTVRLYTNSTCTSAVAATGSSAQLAAPGLAVTVAADFTTTFWATATDAVGSVSGCSTSSITYVEDSTPPAVPAIDSSPATPGNDATPTWAFSAVGAASYECRLTRGATVVSDWAACTSAKTYDLSSQPDGTYSFGVRALDAAGNTSSSAGSSYDYDSSAPAPPSIGSAPSSPGSFTTLQWSFSGEAGAAFECRLERGATVVSDWAACSSPRIVDLSSEPDGSYSFSVRARDLAGNTGATTSSTYVLDRAAPGPPSIASSPPSPGNDATPEWGFSGEGGATFECRLERGATVVSGWAACSDPKSFDLSSEPDGSYLFSVRARDAAGNTGAATSSTYLLDTSAPGAPSIDSAPASPDDDPMPAWSFSGEAGATLECRLERGATVVSGWAPCTDPRAYDLSSEPDGSYSFFVRARDAAGNAGPVAGSSYELDRSAPAPPSIDLAPPSPGSDRSPSWVFSGEAGAAFECRLSRGATVVSDWSSCSGPRTYDLLLEPDGVYTFDVRATDAAGNTGTAVSSGYELDTLAPGAPSIDSSPPSPGNDPTPQWNFSGESGASFECRLARGATVVSDWAACSGPKAYDLSSEPDGSYELSVRATDAAGNTGSPASSTYLLDTDAPAQPSIDGSPASPGNDATPSWSFTGEPGAALECRLERGATTVSDWAACSGPQTPDLSSEPDGSYTFLVRAVDPAGNTGQAASSGYELDRAAPSAPAIGSGPQSPGNDASPEWSFSGEPGAATECRLERGATVISDWAACSDPAAYDLSSEPDGSYLFSVRATDDAGNTGAPATSAYQLDRSAPAPPSIDSAPPSPGNDATPQWGFSGEGGASFECRLARGATTVSDWAACSDPEVYDLSAEPDGTYSFSVRATDAAGNTGAAAGSSYELDTNAPAPPSIDTSPASPDNDASPSWAFSGEGGASFECRLERGATTVSDWTGCSSPEGFDLSAEPDGDYNFSVRARDAAGNTGTPSASGYELDTTAPATPSIDSSPLSPSNGTTPSWSFSGPAGAGLECRLERGAAVVSDWASCASPQAYDLGSEPDGDYSFLVRATDAVGNSSAPASSTYTLDSSIPSVPAIDSTPGVVGNDASPAWGFSGDPGAAFECRLERGATVVSGWSACSSPEAFDLAGEPDGSYSFSVRARNGAGGTSAPATSDYELDRSAPGAPTIGSAPASPDNDVAPSWSFSGEAGASFECRLSRGASVVSDWAACSSPEGFDLSGQPDGSYTFEVRASDAAGNTGAPASSDYELDTTAPGQPSIDSAPASPGTATTPSWSFSGDPGAALECRLARGATVVSDWTTCSSPEAYDISSQPDGSYSFSVRARDNAGNTGAAASSTYVLDRTGASVQIDAGPGAAGSDRSPQWAFSAEAGASFECRLERAGASVSAWGACSSPEAFDLGSEPDGVYTFSVRATDSLGNQGAAAGSDYELDTVAPGAPAITDQPASPSSDRSPAWAFNAEAGASVQCRLEGAGVVVADWSACASPSSHDLSGRPDGRYELSVRATDAAGNTGPAAAAGFDLDTTAPDPPEITAGPGRSGEDATPAWAFRGEQGASFECALSHAGRAVSGPQACTSPVGYDLTSEPDGGYSLTLRARDAAGNLSRAATADYELDRTPGSGEQPDPGNGDPGATAPRQPDRLLPAGGTPPAAPGFGPGGPAPAGEPSEPSAGGAPSGGGPVGEAISGKLKPMEGEAEQPRDEGGSPVLKALGRAARAVARNADKSVFPGLLVAMVLSFFGIQNRIDRNDPKLGLAPTFADPDLEFGPPPTKP